MYDPSVGRWLAEDPIGFEALDANLARYVGNAPTYHTDPTGLASKAIKTHAVKTLIASTLAQAKSQGIVPLHVVSAPGWIGYGNTDGGAGISPSNLDDLAEQLTGLTDLYNAEGCVVPTVPWLELRASHVERCHLGEFA